ncbi:MAG: helix-turn-helix domain-containing protein, partial [Beijerinckiaceae bacterium]
MLRGWRQKRRLSQIDLAVDADLSTRHLSFLENGRANPSRDMVIALAESLFLPPGECNQLLVAAGFAPVYAQRALDDPALAAMRHAVEQILKTHEPFPAVAVDRRWTLLAKNNAVQPLLAGVAPFLLEPPVNVLR